jgi:hypothetical protein
MRLYYSINFRRFNKHDERGDSGYYNGLSARRTATIEVNRNDDALEQILTIYHEVTHALLDFLARYKIDKKYKVILKNKNNLRKDWVVYDQNGDKEELICRAVEAQVKRVFKRQIPDNFYEEFFAQAKDFRKTQKKRFSKKIFKKH